MTETPKIIFYGKKCIELFFLYGKEIFYENFLDEKNLAALTIAHKNNLFTL